VLALLHPRNASSWQRWPPSDLACSPLARLLLLLLCCCCCCSSAHLLMQPEKSWEMMEEMIGNSMEFYESLNIPYKVRARLPTLTANRASRSILEERPDRPSRQQELFAAAVPDCCCGSSVRLLLLPPALPSGSLSSSSPPSLLSSRHHRCRVDRCPSSSHCHRSSTLCRAS
jgi:hypothetical protein